MKATELMIGDLVLDGKNPAQITGITCDELFETTLSPSVGGECIFPIPLTTEILRKNGLFHDPYLNDVEDCDGDNFLPCHFEEDEESNLELIKDNGKIYWSISGGEYYIIELRYVHQLQHALRLCGINKDIKL